MSAYNYDTIIKYVISAKCAGPLHIGSAEGDSAEVLIHPVDDRPFIQASSLTGVLRNWYNTADHKKCEELFGKSRFNDNTNATEFQSRVRISDGVFNGQVKIERRPHVNINPATGSVSSSKGSGQKFDIEYIGAGAEFTFTAYLYQDSSQEQLRDGFEMILAALKAGELQFGAKKSNGGGKVELLSVAVDEYNLKDSADRKLWGSDEGHTGKYDSDYISKLPDNTFSDIVYRVSVSGKSEGAIQIKGIAVSDYGPKAPDSENFRNAEGQFVVPGSSLKGAVRSRMEMIAEYLGKPELIADCFGTANETEKSGKRGNLVFEDSIIGNVEKNSQTEIRHRIHIDKFTGGVMNQALFSEKNAFGDVNFTVSVHKNNNPDASLGLLIFALRDLALGMFNLGNGYSTGKGFIDVDTISITRIADGKSAKIMPEKQQVEDEADIISNALKAAGNKEVSE